MQAGSERPASSWHSAISRRDTVPTVGRRRCLNITAVDTNAGHGRMWHPLAAKTRKTRSCATDKTDRSPFVSSVSAIGTRFWPFYEGRVQTHHLRRTAAGQGKLDAHPAQVGQVGETCEHPLRCLQSGPLRAVQLTHRLAIEDGAGLDLGRDGVRSRRASVNLDGV